MAKSANNASQQTKANWTNCKEKQPTRLCVLWLSKQSADVQSALLTNFLRGFRPNKRNEAIWAAGEAEQHGKWGFLDQVCGASGLDQGNNKVDDLPSPVQVLFKYWATHKQNPITLEAWDLEPVIKDG